MKRFYLAAILLMVVFAVTASAQRVRLGKVCGDPATKCRGSETFQPFELKYEIRNTSVISDSVPFYAIILKSVKIKPDDNCENAIGEAERLEIQALFPRNKVFALKCSEPGDVYYTNVANDVSFIAAYAGATQAEAAKFLKTVQAAKRFGKVSIRKMHAGINGT